MGKNGSSPSNQNDAVKEASGLSDKTLSRYFREIMKYPLLSPEEEKALAKRAREGDIEARNKLILHNLRWVVNIAKQYQNRGLSLAELINEGNAGLIQAVMKYDERKKTRLTTYSNWWIRYYIVSALLNRNLIKLPSKYRRIAKKIKDSYPRISQKIGREPSIEELAEELGVTPEDVSYAFNCGISELSLQDTSFDNGKITYEELIENTITPSPERELVRKSLSNSIAKAVKRYLNPRERYVLFRHFGISFPEESFSIKEIAEMTGRKEEEIKTAIKAIFKKILTQQKNIDLRKKELKKEIYENYDKVKKVLKEVNLFEREVFLLYTGLVSGEEPMNLREIGDVLGITREASRQIKEKALSKLKKVINPQDFHTYFREEI